MTARNPLMRNIVHTRHAAILAATLLMAVALPVTVLFSREDGAAPDAAAPRTELAVADMAVPARMIDVTTAPTVEWSGEATQSASMVLVGSLLIGIGSIVRRAV